jgi:glycosyltransferase involved in cell wall biosynthesis
LKQAGSASPRRIAIVTAGFDIGGGVPTIARWLRDGLRSLGGYTVDVHDLATSSRDRFSRRLRAPRSWVRSTLRGVSGDDGVIHWGANAVEIEAMRYLPRQELKRTLEGYDIVQVVSGGPALARAVTGAGVPVVLWAASRVAWERQRKEVEQGGPVALWRRGMTLLTTRLERRAIRSVDSVLVLNTPMLEYVRSIGQANVAKALPGVDTNRFSPSPVGWQNQGHLLSVCRLNDPRKGLDRMIHAYALVVEADVSAPPLVLAGRGAPPETLIDLVGRLGLSSRVTVCSNISHDDLPKLYRDASVFLQTSYEEGLGMSILEAMASGLPVVSTETAGTKETVVNGVTGWLVPQDAGLDTARLVAHRVVDVLRGDGAALGADARDRCMKAFSSHIAIQRFTDVYEQLLPREKVAS